MRSIISEKSVPPEGQTHINESGRRTEKCMVARGYSKVPTQNFPEKLQPLARQIQVQGAQPCDVPTRPCQARDQPVLDGMGGDSKDDWDRIGCVLGGYGSRPVGDKDIDRQPY